MRLFLAINFPETVKDRLFSAACALREMAGSGSITRRENFHLTLVFLGEIPPDRVPAIQSAMHSASGFSLTAASIGRFRRPQGDLYWAGVMPNPELQKLRAMLCKALRASGFPIESRAFRPHLTLGRGMRLTDAAFSACADLLPPMEIPVSSYSLMCSERRNGIPTYTELHRQLL